MQTLVIYDSKFGNTERIAQAIGRGAGTHGNVRIVAAADAASAMSGPLDLLFIGGPTQRRSMSPGLAQLVDGLARNGTNGVAMASFDTRYRGSTWIMGSAANDAAKRLAKAGARLVASPESFFIGRGGPLERQTLEAGEIDRAEEWGRAVAAGAGRR